jgi:hypothetical protein
MDRFKELRDRKEIYQAAIQIGLWGYPRGIEDADLDPTTRWFMLGDACIFWCEVLDDDSVYFHVCANGDAPKRHPANARRLLYALEFIADMLGCWRIMASDCEVDGEVASYLRRMGFTATEEFLPLVWYERRLVDVRPERSEDI